MREFDKIKEMQDRKNACACDDLPVKPETCKVAPEKVCFSPCASAIRIIDACYCFCGCGCGCVPMKPAWAYKLQKMNMGRIVDSECCAVLSAPCGACGECEDCKEPAGEVKVLVAA